MTSENKNNKDLTEESIDAIVVHTVLSAWVNNPCIINSATNSEYQRSQKQNIMGLFAMLNHSISIVYENSNTIIGKGILKLTKFFCMQSLMDVFDGKDNPSGRRDYQRGKAYNYIIAVNKLLAKHNLTINIPNGSSTNNGIPGFCFRFSMAYKQFFKGNVTPLINYVGKGKEKINKIGNLMNEFGMKNKY